MLQYIEKKINTYTMSDYIMQVLTIKIVMSLDEIQDFSNISTIMIYNLKL